MPLGKLRPDAARRLMKSVAPRESFSVAAFIKGFSVEMEHGRTVNWNPYTIARIVLDHLRERKDYYDRLEQVERGLGSLFVY